MAASYYSDIAPKWAEEYPSSETVSDIWGFYQECGYTDPQASLLNMLEPIKAATSKNRILDYGCDKGLMLDFFCTNMPGTKGYGVDINPTAIEQARTMFPTLNFETCDGISIPYEDKHFHVVIVIATIKHVRYEDRKKVYAELNRVADYALMIEADKREQEPEEFSGWTFYNSNFEKEFGEHFGEVVKVKKEAGDILGLYKCK